MVMMVIMGGLERQNALQRPFNELVWEAWERRVAP